MKNQFYYIAILIATLSISCVNDKSNTKPIEATQQSVIDPTIKSVLTASEQANLSPDEIIAKLKKR